MHESRGYALFDTAVGRCGIAWSASGVTGVQRLDPGIARAVGQALGKNPFPIIVPCHRVLAADGMMGGFSAHGGVATKRRLLMIEGALLQLDL